MKKLLAMVVSVIMVLCLVACGGDSDSSTSTTPSQEQASSVVSESQPVEDSSVMSEASEEISYASMMPDPAVIFPNGTITITDGDGGTAYIFNVTGYADGEFESFVAGCKDLGFTQVEYETSHDKGQDFGAYTEDGAYWVQVNWDSENEIIYVICQESKK